MKSRSTLIAVLLAQAPLSAHADSSDIDHCTRIEDATQRLACYDELFQESSVNHPENAEAEPAATELPRESTAVAEFGAEQIVQPPIEFVEARLVGDFKGWTGQTVFTLDNGQVWRQTKNYIRNYKPKSPIPQARVTISKGMMGSYNLRVEGIKRIVQVKRIK